MQGRQRSVRFMLAATLCFVLLLAAAAPASAQPVSFAARPTSPSAGEPRLGRRGRLQRRLRPRPGGREPGISDNVSILLGGRGRELHGADRLRRRRVAPSRSRWATSTATPTPTSRSRTWAPTTSRSCSAPRAGASLAPTNFAAGDRPRLRRGGRLQRRLRPRPRGREPRTPTTSRSCSAPRAGASRAATSLRRRLVPPSRSPWATSTATPTPTSRSRTRAPTTSRSCSAPPAGASPGRPTSPSASTPSRSRWATSTATPTPTSRSRTRLPTTSRSCSAPRAGASPAPTNFAAGSCPHSVAVGDFNGDSDPDLAVA